MKYETNYPNYLDVFGAMLRGADHYVTLVVSQGKLCGVGLILATRTACK